MFPGLSWKQAGYTNICQDYLTGGTVEAADLANVNWQDFPGYFEAGSALLPTNLRRNSEQAVLRVTRLSVAL